MGDRKTNKKLELYGEEQVTLELLCDDKKPGKKDSCLTPQDNLLELSLVPGWKHVELRAAGFLRRALTVMSGRSECVIGTALVTLCVEWLVLFSFPENSVSCCITCSLIGKL